MAGITESLSAFSEKLKRFNDAGKTDRTVKPAENQQLQRQIRDREERLKSTVIATYKNYKAPFEAMGQLSDRAKAMDQDERSLFKAYNLFSGAMNLNENGEDGKSAGNEGADTETTFISRIEILSPLTQKSAYTTGGQFIYLMMWLYFEKNCREYMPVLAEKENGWSLGFVHAKNYSFENHDREIFEIVRQEFYEGEE